MTAPAPLVVVGDALLDRDLDGRADRLAPDAPVPVVHGARRATRPGGAALAAGLAALDGREVTLVTALGSDEASAALRRLLPGRVRVVALPLAGSLPQKTRILAEGTPVCRLDDGDGRAAGATDEARAALAAAGAVLVSDYGRGTAEVLRDSLAAAASRVPVVWDPHPRGGPPVPGSRAVTPSAAEARRLAPTVGPRAGETTARHGEAAGRAELSRAARDAAALVDGWDVASVVVTLGSTGALLCHGADPLLVPAVSAGRQDACGAGDRFAATLAGLLADGVVTETAVRGAVAAAGRYVAAGGAATLATDGTARGAFGEEDHAGVRCRPHRDGSDTHAAAPPARGAARGGPDGEAVLSAARVRAAGGTVVATGGCFDLLHAGHIALLEAARGVGDHLVVCVNSDASVRRRKGGSRPLVPLADRVRVLRALGCVDAVAVFDEDTPEQLLRELRPDVWAKGGDYAHADLPEAPLVRSWGGQVVLLPYLDGRSTTGIAARAAGHRVPIDGARPGGPQPERSRAGRR
ncbi:D-glycero-beta-D-manno-heptose 1-phosphate adenylyltransferase [Streptomyces lonarensis]|uniref:D-glycero-beta-D-manno-heptose 1-phosphate adenylyltransferase n=1 Tax=Streptomyces lonarensis TaxID=700599 RepID=A0A7X6CZT5_9ACTN|nr:D-glycero-beta-D-manno-heptose 1-phosphate adenylyltransferase [Streptomyces lonarensis]NJQ05586.1 D-glycero-beta-D-manno-heptose 1-phosphate adenylyltransferase [Streptomyces lonarensis]